MKRISIVIIILFIVSAPSSAQWKSTGLDLQATAFGVHDTFLFACFSNGNGFLRFDPSRGWTDASNGIDLSQYPVTSFASLGHLFFASGNRIYRSSDNGTSWTPLGRGVAGVCAPYVFGSSGGSLWRSRDSGNNWIGVPCGPSKFFASIGICVFTVNYNNGTLWRSLDTGSAWSQLSPPNTRLSNLLMMGSLLFITDSAGLVSMSTDSGLHWNPVSVDSAGVKEFVHCLVTDGKNLFAGTGQGVFVSTDTGQTWKPENDGFGRPNINLLCVFDTMLFANGGGSIWDPHTYKRPIREMLPTKSAVQPLVALRDTIAIYPNPATGLVTILAGGTAIERVSVLSVLGVEVLTLDKPGGMSHNSEIALDLSHLPSGTYFLRIQAATGTVLRKVVRE